MRIAPFGYLRINSCLLIPAAFRSLPRPSSAPDAKAFSLRSYQLNHLNYDQILKFSTEKQTFNLFPFSNNCSYTRLRFHQLLKNLCRIFPHLHYFHFLFNFQVTPECLRSFRTSSSIYILNLFRGSEPLGFDSNLWSELVGTNGLEPSTSRLSGVRSNHLSYAPKQFLVCYTFRISFFPSPVLVHISMLKWR